MSFYNFEKYEWHLKTKNHELIKGFFVSFSIPNEITINNYPINAHKDFAFCPLMNYKEFQKNINTLSLIPSYILLFNETDIENLYLSIPIIK